MNISNFRNYRKVIVDRGYSGLSPKFHHHADVTIEEGIWFWKKTYTAAVYSDGIGWKWAETGEPCIPVNIFGVGTVPALASAYAAKNGIADMP